MQIKKLWIDHHLCLENFEINFQINSEGSSSTILIGENGTGKSTMIETILEIFMSFDSPVIEKKMDYDYEIEYQYAQIIHVIKKHGKYYQIRTGDNEHKGTYSTIRRKCLSISPKRIIAFYSGFNNKIEDKIHKQNIQYIGQCRKTLQAYSNALNSGNSIDYLQFPRRKYNYCDETLTPIYLISIIIGNVSFEKEYLINNCHYTRIENIKVSVNLNKVEQLFSNYLLIGENHIEDHQLPEQSLENFYKIVDFIDHQFTSLFRNSSREASDGKEYFILNSIHKIHADPIAILNFFEKLYSLFDAQFDVSVTFGNQSVNVKNMSEGQRQLIKILGMLGISKDEDCLVLMDEPDAHMNPNWKYKINRTIEDCLRDAINTQAIIATHDPMVINGVPKEFIRIFTYDELFKSQNNYFTKVYVPNENTVGLGIDGLLQSEYYGLITVLDETTRKLMKRKNELIIKKVEGQLTQDERQELKVLSNKLDDLFFTRNIPTDEYYDEYIAAMHKIYRELEDNSLSPKEIAERNKNAEEIIRGILNI